MKRFDCFIEDLIVGTHNLKEDKLRLMLVCEPPDASLCHRSELSEVPGRNGYQSGGEPVSIRWSGWKDGAYCISFGGSVKWTAKDGGIGPCVAVAFYNDSHPRKPLIAWQEFPPFALEHGEWVSVDFDKASILIQTA